MFFLCYFIQLSDALKHNFMFKKWNFTFLKRPFHIVISIARPRAYQLLVDKIRSAKLNGSRTMLIFRIDQLSCRCQSIKVLLAYEELPCFTKIDKTMCLIICSSF